MALILEPLLENPDGYQIALIKKILNKIKISDDGLASSAVNQLAKTENQTGINKTAFQNLYTFNKVSFYVQVHFFEYKKILLEN